MKKSAHTQQKNDRPLALLGGLGAREFLREYWQKKPLLIRGAFADFVDPLDKKAIMALAARDDAESRLIANDGGRWRLTHGPFSRRDFAAVKETKWTVLVQDTQHFSRAAHDVLAHFNFIPHARIDDLMVSYAVPGAGVGAHFDSYDVFLLQGAGKRRWRISAQTDLRIKAGMPLKVLARFKPEHEYLLETGDMLYLPPGFAHEGIAETESLTWSVGFRAPSAQELSVAMLDYLRDEVAFDGEYRDPDLLPSRNPGAIDEAMITTATTMLAAMRAAAGNAAHIKRCLGRLLTEPKPHVFFEAPEPVLTLARFRARALSHGVELDLKSRLLYDRDSFYFNGATIEATPFDTMYLRQLADARCLPPGVLALVADSPLLGKLFDAYREGGLRLI